MYQTLYRSGLAYNDRTRTVVSVMFKDVLVDDVLKFLSIVKCVNTFLNKYAQLFWQKERPV